MRLGSPVWDGRLQGQERALLGATFMRRGYVPPRMDWDHDHCEFCWRKSSLARSDLHEGYATASDRWVCDECFADLRERFALVVE